MKAILRPETPALTSFLKQFRQGNTLLLTLGNLRSLPELYNQETTSDPLCPVKFFGGAWTWYPVECEIDYVDENPDRAVFDIRFFGKVVVNGESELGYFSLREIGMTPQRGLVVGYGPFSFKNERDQYWMPRPLSECN